MVSTAEMQGTDIAI